jgi:predicted O-methyltransferase YrrM
MNIIAVFRRTIKENHGLLRQMEEFAAEHDIPISQPETMRFIEVL